MYMYGLGTLINAAAIVLGGILGLLFGKLLKQRHQDTLCKTCGILFGVVKFNYRNNADTTYFFKNRIHKNSSVNVDIIKKQYYNLNVF